MTRVLSIEPDPEIAWVGVNDAVMGGVSTGTAKREADGTIVFSGTVSFERNGGFASARRPLAGPAFSGLRALRLHVLGDGKRYKLAAYTDAGASGFAYQAGFATSAGVLDIVVLPLSSFEARFRGRAVGDAPPLEARAIRAVGFVIADRQEGPFRLRVEAIEGLLDEDGEGLSGTTR